MFTPCILDLTFPDNALLLAAIQQERAADPKGINASNIHGWHSKYSLFQEPAFHPILRGVQDAAEALTGRELKLTLGWAIMSPKGARNMTHSHAGSEVAAVYYVQADPGSSPLMFHDPDGMVEARPGRLVLFHGTHRHHVAENQLDSDRVVLSINFNLKPS